MTSREYFERVRFECPTCGERARLVDYEGAGPRNREMRCDEAQGCGARVRVTLDRPADEYRLV
jgi:hypothetical protein